MIKKSIILVIIFAMMALGVFNAFGISSYSLDKTSYSPGDKATLTINLDLSYTPSSGTFLRFKDLVVEVYSFNDYKSYYVGSSTSATNSISVPVFIPEEAGSSIYRVSVKVSGTAVISENAKTKTDTLSTQSVVALKVVKKPRISIKFSQNEVREGENTEIEICNYGGKAREVEVSLTGNYSLKEARFFIDKLEGCVKKNITIESSLEGKQSIPFLLKYKDEVGDEKEELIYVPASINRGKTVFIIKHANEIISGKESKIKLKIKNLGNDGEEVRIKAKNGLDFVGKSEILINRIGKGEEKVIEEMVYTDLSPGVKTVDFEIVWREQGKEKTEIINVPLSIVSDDEVEVYLEAEPLPLSFGKEHSISIVVANKAKYEISGVSVGIESKAFKILDLSDKKFIGTLQPDDFSSEQFKVKIVGREGEYNTTVKLSYKDPSGESKEKLIVILIKVYAGEEKTDLTIFIIAGILVVIGIGLKRREILERIRGRR